MSTPFGKTEFIDFDTGTVTTAPMVLQDSLSQPFTLADKIRLFRCRVEVWTLGVAAQMLKEIESHHECDSIWCHAAYGPLAIVTSYFEMIGKSLNPNSKNSGTASRDFNFGFCDVYPRFVPTSIPAGACNREDAEVPLVPEFRDRLRNGIYHIGYTKHQLYIHNDDSITHEDFDKKIGSDSTPRYYVNPHRLVRTLINHFPDFVTRLHGGLATKFEQFFDSFHKPQDKQP